MKMVDNEISIAALTEMSKKMFGGLVKAVVDVEKEIMAVDAELHSDLEGFLLEKGSEQINLWGINIYSDLVGGQDWVEFDSMINIRPFHGNRSRGVENQKLRKKIITIVNKLVKQ